MLELQQAKFIRKGSKRILTSGCFSPERLKITRFTPAHPEAGGRLPRGAPPTRARLGPVCSKQYRVFVGSHISFHANTLNGQRRSRQGRPRCGALRQSAPTRHRHAHLLSRRASHAEPWTWKWVAAQECVRHTELPRQSTYLRLISSLRGCKHGPR